MPQPLIIFDFDGVIIDSAHVHQRAYTAVFAALGRVFPLATATAWRERYQSHWELNFTNNGIDPANIRAVLDKYWTFVDYSDAVFFPGVGDVVRDLAVDHQLAILSSTKSALISTKLTELGVRNLFWNIDGRDDVSDKAVKLNELLQQAQVTPQNAVMIGDTESDIEAATLNQTHSIAVTYGWYPRARFAATPPGIFVDIPNQIPEAVRQVLLNKNEPKAGSRHL